MLLTIIIFIIVLSVLVFAHELGHFFTARRLGVRAEEFGFGFPPRAIGVYRNRLGQWKKVVGNQSVDSLNDSQDKSIQPAPGVTIYSLNWLPIGGFVKIKGENGEGKDDQESFAAKKIWQRILILSAGVIMNIILAWVLFSVGYMLGLPQTTDTVSKQARISESQVVVMEVSTDSPAARAGLQADDSILQFDHQIIGEDGSLPDLIAASANREVEILIRRGDQEKVLKIIPETKDNGQISIGIGYFSAGLVQYPVLPAIWEGLKTTGWLLKEIVVAFVNLFADIFRGHNIGDQFAGPVGIANITGQAARLGFTFLLQFVALLSLNLAIINILPFPALDGGRIVFLLIEKIIGRPVRRDIEALIHNLGFLLLIALIIFITYKDIINLFK